MQLDHVNHTYRCFLVESLSGFTIVQISMTVHGDRCLNAVFPYLFSSCSIENRCCEFHSKFLSSPSEYSFIYLSEVHTAWYTKRIQHNINRSSILKERHVFSTNDLRNNSFITVATRHLI